MTLADYILSKSTLPSGTIFDHILAMQTGGVQGAVFASMFSVSVEQASVVVVNRAIRKTQYERPVVMPIARKGIDGNKSIRVSSATEIITALSVPDEVSVFTGTARTTTFSATDSINTRQRK